MYENYTRQALPDREYREVLGTAICVFNANNSFIIENILRSSEEEYSWYKLIDKEAGCLLKDVENTIALKSNNNIADLFKQIIWMRNRIIHSFQITDSDGKQILCTKTRVKDGNIQFVITKEYLMEFIKKNECLSSALHEFRGY